METPDTIESVQHFYQRYPQVGTSEVSWLNSLEWRGHTVLDAGCGDGGMLEAIQAHHSLQLGIGLDTSQDSLDVAAKRKLPGFKWLNGSIFQIPLNDCEVDDVISIGVLHYFKDPSPAIKEFARVAKPGGRVILFVYRPHVVHTVRQWLARRYGSMFARRLERVGSDIVKRNLVMNTVAPPPYWPLSRRDLHVLANTSGLVVERVIHKPTHVPQLLLSGQAGDRPRILRRLLASFVELLVKFDPLHFWSFGYYVIYRRKRES